MIPAPLHAPCVNDHNLFTCKCCYKRVLLLWLFSLDLTQYAVISHAHGGPVTDNRSGVTPHVLAYRYHVLMELPLLPVSGNLSHHQPLRPVPSGVRPGCGYVHPSDAQKWMVGVSSPFFLHLTQFSPD